MNELRYALRSLLRAPGATAVSVFTLALGLGAATTIFSLLNAVVLNRLPYFEPDRIVTVREHEPKTGNSFAVAPPAYFDWRAETRSFSAFAAVAGGWFNLVGTGEPERIAGASVTADFAEALGIAPSRGRWFVEANEAPGSDGVVVLSHDLWRDRFGGDPAIVGKTITLTDRVHVVVGVMPAGFAYPDESRVWVPLAIGPDERVPEGRRSHYLDVVARLAPGVAPEAADAELDRISLQAAPGYTMLDTPLGARLESLHETLVGDARTPLLIVFGAVLFVLLIAVVNVANLELAQATARARETAVRTALGAGRWRIVRLAFIRSLLLSAAGGILGILLASWLRDSLVAMAPADLPRLADTRINARVFAFALGVAALAGLGAGLVPALGIVRGRLMPTLKDEGRGVVAPARLRGALVVAQLALSTVLLAGGGLMLKSLWRLMTVDPGFHPGGVWAMELTLPQSRYPDPRGQGEFFERVLESVRTIPGVEAAGATTNLPLSRTNMIFGFHEQGREPAPGAEIPGAQFRAVSFDYLSAIGIPRLRGRGLSPDDRAGAPNVVVINDAMARRYWPDREPIGQRIAVTRGEWPVWREIVGVVGDIRHRSLREEPTPEIYAPFQQIPFPFMRVVVRGGTDRRALADALRRAVWSVDRDQPVVAIRPLTDLVRRELAPARLQAILLGGFAGLAVVLATVGLYGVVAYGVSRRVREIGVRVALGAERADITAMVLGGAARLVAAGALLGGIGAVLLTRVLRRLLYGVSPTDPVTLAAVIVLLGGVALLASAVPARRAARVDPMDALRYE
jgi:predicted permease